jgi:hypothetical protein
MPADVHQGPAFRLAVVQGWRTGRRTDVVGGGVSAAWYFGGYRLGFVGSGRRLRVPGEVAFLPVAVVVHGQLVGNKE